jgi:ligand-binding sensor domain-containing protein
VKCFVIVFILSGLFTTYCQSQNIFSPNLVHISEANGLSDNKVQCILKDKEGKVWVGTADGLNLMDGSVVRKFSSEGNQPNSIPSNNILSLAEDAAGTVWIGTDGGLCYYKKEKDLFISFLPPVSEYGASIKIKSICPKNNKQLWCGTEGGLFLFDIPANKFTPFFISIGNTKNNYRLSNHISYLLSDSNQQLWLCTREGLWTYSQNTNTFKKITNEAAGSTYPANCLYAFESQDKKMWVGTSQNGLLQVDKITGIVTSYQQLPGAADKVSCINEIPLANGKYLLMLNGEFQTFDPFTNKFGQLPKPLSLPEYPMINSILHSTDGLLWLGTGEDGLFILNLKAQYFKHHFFEKKLSAQSLFIDEWHSNLLIGGEGINILKLYDSSFIVMEDYHYDILPQPRLEESYSILSIAKESESRWWIGTTAGIIRINPISKYNRWFTSRNRDSSLPNNFINHLFIDRQQSLWVFPQRQGIWQMDKKTGKCWPMFKGFINADSSEKRLSINDAAEDEEGNIWMTDSEEGIVFFDRKTGVFSKPFVKQGGENLNTSKIIFSNGWLYSFNNNIILKWKNIEGIKKIKMPNDIDKIIYDIVQDKSNNYWVAGKTGLFVFNEQQDIFKRFTSNNGLVNNKMDGKLFCRNNGEIIFATAAYLSIFSPASLLIDNNLQQKTILTGLYCNDSIVSFLHQPIHIKFPQNNLLFQWALPSFTNPFANNYYYMLKGIDSVWRFAGNTGEVQYASLAPGKYNLLLKAAADGVLSSNNISLVFIVHPPFWKEWWFILPAGILTAIIFLWLVHKRLSFIKKKESYKRELTELEIKALKSQINAEFIFGNLNSIQQLIASKNTDAADIYLSQFSAYIKRVIENSSKETITIAEELEMVEWYVNLEQKRITGRLTFIIQNKFSNPQFEIPPMMIQPFIENAIWHGLSNQLGEKKITVLLYESKNRVNIVIEDNGIGRIAAAMPAEFQEKEMTAIQLVKDRLVQYSYASSVEITDMADDAGNACGTRVMLHFPNFS